MALVRIGAISGFGPQVRKAQASPCSVGRHTAGEREDSAAVTLNQCPCSEPFPLLHPQNSATGTRQRLSGRLGAERRKGLERLRTSVTGVRLLPGGGKPHVIMSRRRVPFSFPTDPLGKQLWRRQRLWRRHDEAEIYAKAERDFSLFGGHPVAVAHDGAVSHQPNVG